jgi:hypothetical protein
MRSSKTSTSNRTRAAEATPAPSYAPPAATAATAARWLWPVVDEGKSVTASAEKFRAKTDLGALLV